MLGNAPKNPPGLDDIFNLGAPQQSAYDDLNLNFNAFVQPEPTANSQGGNGVAFDPFGNGFGDSGNVPLKPMNPSQQPSKESSPQQSHHPQPVIIECKILFFYKLQSLLCRQTGIHSLISQILLPV